MTTRHHRAQRTVLACGVSAVLFGCDILDPGHDCSLEERFGLAVFAVSEVGGTPVTEGLVVVARDGDYVEQLGFENHNARYGAPERRGTYEITVEATGFETRTVENVRVIGDECHVRPVELTVELSPQA